VKEKQQKKLKNNIKYSSKNNKKKMRDKL